MHNVIGDLLSQQKHAFYVYYDKNFVESLILRDILGTPPWNKVITT